jgi:hypothetical protein
MLSGYRTRNQIKRLLDENLEDDGFGDKYWKPTNIQWADEPTPINAPQPPGPGSEQTGTGDGPEKDQSAARADAIRKLIVSQLTTARRREEKARARQIDKPTFPQWVDKFYLEHRGHIRDVLQASLEPFLDAFLPERARVAGRLFAWCGDAAAMYAAQVLAAAVADWESASLSAVETTADKLTECLFGAELCTAT